MQQQQQQPQCSNSISRAPLLSEVLEDSWETVKKLTRREKIVRIVAFTAQYPHFPPITCAGIDKECTKCPQKLLSRWSWYLNPPHCKTKGQFPMRSCQLPSEGAHYLRASEDELTKMCHALIDFEALHHCISEEDYHCKLAHSVTTQAFEKLTIAINQARILSASQPNAILKYLGSVHIEQASISADSPSIKKALCNLLLEKEQYFGDAKYHVYQLSKFVIHYLNNYILEHPSRRTFSLEKSDQLYERSYQRWLACVVLPATYRTFIKYNLTDIFGIGLLTLIYHSFRDSLWQQLKSEYSDFMKEHKCNAETHLKYIFLPNFLIWLGREFVSEVEAPFWQRSTANGIGRNTRTATQNCMTKEINGDLSLFKEMELFVERLQLTKNQFSFDDFEQAHIQLNFDPNEDVENGQDDECLLLSGKVAFCLAHYYLSSLQQLVTPTEVILDDQSYQRCMSKRSQLIQKPTRRQPMREPTVEYGDAIRQIAKFFLNDEHLVECAHLWSYIYRNVHKSSLHQVMRSILDEVVMWEENLNTPASLDEDAPRICVGSEQQYSIALQRDSDAREEERLGIIRLHVIQNLHNGEELEPEQLMWLIALQNVYSQQLPKMGKDYISRLLLDPRHATLVMLKDDNRVVGGITFRPFKAQGFSEIVFCAVSSKEQIKGYGTRMMNFLKDYHIANGVLFLLAYADTHALDYFKKQGFEQRIRLEPECYTGYVKDYDSACLMQCWLNPLVAYSDTPIQLRFQKLMMQKIIERRQSRFKTVTHKCTFDQTRRMVSPEFIEKVNIQNALVDLSLIDFEDHSAELKPKLKSILREVKKHKAASHFREPVDSQIAPDYYKTIKYPMDLSQMMERLKKGYYVNLLLFHSDMRRIFTNCRAYNAEGTEFYSDAVKLELFYESKLKESGLLGNDQQSSQ